MRKKARRLKIVEVVLLVLGTVIVFATYYVHEIKLEEVKELKASISRAKEESTMHLQTNAVLFDILAAVIDVQRMQPSGNSRDFAWLDLHYKAQARQIDNGHLMVSLEAFNSLAVSLESKHLSLPNPMVFLRELTNLNERDTDLMNYIETKRASPIKLTQTEFEKELRETALRNESNENHFSKVRNDFNVAALKLLNISTRVENESKESYERYTYWSYFLYPFGFLLGLAGKLIGIEDAVEE